MVAECTSNLPVLARLVLVFQKGPAIVWVPSNAATLFELSRPYAFDCPQYLPQNLHNTQLFVPDLLFKAKMT